MLSAQGSVSQTVSGIKVSQTIAQQATTGTTTSAKIILSQGFQQSKISNKTIVNQAITTLIYPNPIVDFINFKFSDPIEGKINFSLFDIHGRLVFYEEKEAIQNILTITNLTLANGEYFAKLEAKKYFFTTKIIKL